MANGNNIELLEESVKEGLIGVSNNHGGPFGAIIVRDGKIIGRGHNRVTSTNDPTAHAEITAIRDACKNENNFHLSGAIIYTSCEPCLMCLSAIYWANIDSIYYSSDRYEAADIGFDDDFIYKELEKDVKDRSIPLNRIELQSGKDLFNSWRNKNDRIDY